MSEIIRNDGLYEPRPFEQDRHGCQVAVLANVATVLDGDVTTFDAISEQLGRAPDTYVSDEQTYRWALDARGYQVKHIGSFDAERLRVDGVEYAVEYYAEHFIYGGDISSTIREYYQENLAQIIQGAERLNMQLDPYKLAGQYDEEVRNVSAQDVAAAIDNRSVVQLNILRIDGTSHCVLVCGQRSDGLYKIFDSQGDYHDKPSIHHVSARELERPDVTSAIVYSKR